MENGTYVLTQDVQNPKPDRRTKHDPWCRIVFPAGTRFQIEVVVPDFSDIEEFLVNAGFPEADIEAKRAEFEAEPRDFRIRLTRGLGVHKSHLIKQKPGSSDQHRQYHIWRAIQPFLKPEAPTLGHLLRSRDFDQRFAREAALLLLVDSGKVSLDEVEEVLERAAELSEDDYNAVAYKHGI